MNIGIDIDDTITNSSDIFIKYARKYNQIKKIDYEINVNELDQFLAFGWTDNNKKEFIKLYLKKILTEAKTNNNSSKIIKKLKLKGYKIYLISARNDFEMANMYEFTKNWLAKNQILYDYLYINCKNKLDICMQNKIDIFIDDNYDTCNQIKNNSNIKVLMYATRYNNLIKSNILRVKNWKQIFLFINKYEEEKNEKKEIKIC